MDEIFVSYARSTAKQAQAVARGLRDQGWAVWLDDDLPAHRAYTDVIDEKLRAASAVVVVWSAEAVKSEWVQSEADAARLSHKLVQLSVDGARLPMPFDRIQCADLTGWSGDAQALGWRKVLASVSELVGASAAAASGQASIQRDPLLAVLAFDNLSGDPEMAYFSDGVSEEILQTVARGAELKVVGRGSSFQFRGRDKAAAHVGAMLRATHVLDGSVRRSGPKVRIAANLIECERETTVWSDRFDRELSDVFALQDEIAGAVAAALKVAFAPAAPAESVDPAAYAAYLQARELRNRGLLAPQTVVKVIALLREATRLAPRFARAWEFLATMEVEHVRFDQDDGRPPALKRAEVVAAAETALRLDPTLGAAHQALGALEAFGRFAEREALHRKALAVAPNDPTVLTNASLFFAEVGRMREATQLARQAYALDPMYPWAATWYATALIYEGQGGEGRRLLRSLCDRWPDNELVTWGAAWAAGVNHDWDWLDELVDVVRRNGFDGPSMRRTLAWADNVRNPNPEYAARRVAQANAKLARDGVLPLGEFESLAVLGFLDEALALVEQASFAYMSDPDKPSPNGADGPAVIFSVPEAGPWQRDPSFVRLCAKLGLCDYWTESGRWPDCADEVPYDFRAEARRFVDAAQPSSEKPA